MDSKPTSSLRNIWIGVVFFLIFIPPGLWTPALPNILESYDALWVIPYATAVGPIVAIFSSLMFASLADRKIPAQKLLGILTVSGSVFLYLQFSSLSWGWNPWFYVFFQGCNALISAPMYPLLAMIALANTDNAQKKFPLYHLWGTLGWLSAGVLVSWLALDSSADAGKIGAGVRLCLGGICFLLPATRPTGKKAKSWQEALGLRAFSLFKDKSLRAYYITALLFAIPIASHYMYAPKLLKQLAELEQNVPAMQSWLVSVLPGPTAQMALGQCTEIGAMLLLSWLGARARVKPFVLLSMSLAIVRFGLYAAAGQWGWITLMWLGVALHGPIFAFFSVTGKVFVNRRVSEDMRGQAQALLALMGGSIGQTMGALSCGMLYNLTSAGQSYLGWTIFWSVLAVIVIGCTGYFTLSYRQKDEV